MYVCKPGMYKSFVHMVAVTKHWKPKSYRAKVGDVGCRACPLQRLWIMARAPLLRSEDEKGIKRYGL